MARAYSQDLRDRVIDAAFVWGARPAGGGSVRDRNSDGDPVGSPGARTGDHTAGRQGQPRRSKLDPHRDYILGPVDDDAGHDHQRDAGEACRGARRAGGRATLWTFLDRCGLTFKKSPRTRRSRTVPTS